MELVKVVKSLFQYAFEVDACQVIFNSAKAKDRAIALLEANTVSLPR